MNTYCKSLIFNILLLAAFAQKWVKLSAGGEFITALRSDGTIWESGSNYFGELGQADTVTINTLSMVGTDTDWVNISTGAAACFGLKRDGTIWSWGDNINGELGLGDSINRSVPIQIGSDSDWVSISSGTWATYGIKKDGSIWSWGYNYYGQLGTGQTIDQAIPVQIDGTHAWLKICGGATMTYALRSDHTLWAWGDNEYGQLGNGTNISVNNFECSVSASIQNTGLVENNGIRVYPNPFSDIVNISIYNNELSKVGMYLYDLNGKQLSCDDISMTNNEIRLDLSLIPQGMYFLEIVSDNLAFRTKLVKE